MNLYLDTNILISFVFEAEQYHNQIVDILKRKTSQCYTGIISWFEFKCIIGEFWRENKISTDEETKKKINALPVAQQSKILADMCWAQIPVELIAIPGQENLEIVNKSYLVPNNLNLAIRIAHLLPLRAPDLLQIAAAINFKVIQRIPIEYLLTNDVRMLKYAQAIYQVSKIMPIASADLLTL